ncbi:MAG: biotin carboxylase N-terminal domain-containing protein [Polyangiaceae bacterium]|nr:biotin carboxylase N-terminal domain-containing protein [Polyangiaceae bacterium]
MKRILIANRGEIAIRFARTFREMGIESVAVYAAGEEASPHVRYADFAELLPGSTTAQTYLNIEAILAAASRSQADAIAPGYGFLSENADFAEACERHGLTFLGPSPNAIRTMGSKTAAREAMSAAGVPLVPGGPADDLEQARQTAQALGYPVFIKARAGGGGKGMRRVTAEAQLEPAYEVAKSEAERAFGDSTVYLEKALIRPRHVEIQVLGDTFGNVVHLFERDCSIQRRHQKIVEESPSPLLSRAVVERMGAIAVQGAKAVGYYSAGTFEFLVDEAENFYFLEMNTRLQVEHPITELVTGFDLVREMVRVANGEALGFNQEAIVARGAAIECRVYAEDPDRGFLPSPGLIRELREPGGPGVRNDSGVAGGATISELYDPLMSKLCVWAPTRAVALARMRAALKAYVVVGPTTNLKFHERLLQHPSFERGEYYTSFVEENLAALTCNEAPIAERAREVAVAIAAALFQAESVAQPTRPAAEGLSPWVAAHRRRM